ncbi:hypothetical protein L0128_01400 [candidate division KSB1 bacterium]|nr:hypothetical protein [candidate division KSB1 bacterium]
MEKSLKKCPDLQEIERLRLMPTNDAAAASEVAMHLKHCTRCRAKYAQFDRFYRILTTQLTVPIANAAINLVKQLQGESLILSTLALHPCASALTPWSSYKAVLYYNLPALPKSYPSHSSRPVVLVRFLQDAQSLSGCVTVSSRESCFNRNLDLYFMRLGKYISINEAGFGVIECDDLALFDQEMVALIPRNVKSDKSELPPSAPPVGV